MEFKLFKNNFLDTEQDICISKDSKKLIILFAGNLDLYWMAIDENMKSGIEESGIEMEITKENSGVYSLFERLFYDMENINLFDDELSEEEKLDYAMFNKSNYNALFNGNTITWYSDETNPVAANYVQIIKEKDSFRLHFYVQEDVQGYDGDVHHFNRISIRFRNSGSRYDPFNVLFMKMYHGFQDVDDVLDEGHQISFDEMLYEEKKVRQRKK